MGIRGGVSLKKKKKPEKEAVSSRKKEGKGDFSTGGKGERGRRI